MAPWSLVKSMNGVLMGGFFLGGGGGRFVRSWLWSKAITRLLVKSWWLHAVLGLERVVLDIVGCMFPGIIERGAYETGWMDTYVLFLSSKQH